MQALQKRLELNGITVKRMQKVEFVYPGIRRAYRIHTNGYIITESLNFSGSAEALKAHKKETDTFVKLDKENVNKAGGLLFSGLVGLLGIIAVVDGVVELL